MFKVISKLKNYHQKLKSLIHDNQFSPMKKCFKVKKHHKYKVKLVKKKLMII